MSDGALIGTWSPGIGDPSIMGWLTVVLYLVAAPRSFSLARGRNVRVVRREATVWWLFTLGVRPSNRRDGHSSLGGAPQDSVRRGGRWPRRRAARARAHHSWRPAPQTQSRYSLRMLWVAHTNAHSL